MIHSSPRSRFTPRRTALTIVETMVSMSAISLLLAMLIPAVQAARECARRTNCLNNLREVLQACAVHESARGEFPYTSVTFFDNKHQSHPACSPHARLLPYLEQGATYSEIDFADYPIDVAAGPLASMRNGALISFSISVVRCPSDSGLPGGNNYRACMGFGPGIFTPKETTQCTDPGNGTGAFVNGRGVKAAEFLDGLANTVMFSERVMGSRGAFRPYSDYRIYLGNICTAADAIGICESLAAGPTDSNGGSTWLFGGWRQTWYNHILTPNSRIPDCSAGDLIEGGGNGAYTARSYHPGGVNSAMADGSARFVSEGIDAFVWRVISTRAGGEAQPSL
jgi:prepilin-type processing-associated H-X9-DG protein